MFIPLLPLQAGRGIRRGDKLGVREASKGIIALSFGSLDDARPVDDAVRGLIDSIRPIAASVRDLLAEQEADWCIRVFRGSDPLAGYEAILPATFEHAAAIGLPIRRKIGQ